MPRAEAGSSKAIGNAMKARGLQKLRYYCQVCEKQCRDENGFKCHTMTEGHLRQMLLVGEQAGKHIDDYSTRFEKEFVALLSRRWGTKRIKVNQCYQEYIQDKTHLHMNATRFLSLTEFAKHLGRTGVAHIDDTEKGLYIAWIDNSPAALARQAESQKKQRSEVDEETRQRRAIEAQIAKAKEAQHARKIEQGEEVDEQREGDGELKRELDREGGPVSLSLSFKTKPPSPPANGEHTPAPAAPTSTFIAPPAKQQLSFTPRPNAFKMAANPLKSNALKPNPLAAKPASISIGQIKRPAPMSAVESIFQEEMARKNGGGPKRGRFD